MWNHKQQDNYRAWPLVIITDIKRGGHNLFLPNPWSVKCVTWVNVTSLSTKQKRMNTRPIALTTCVSLKGDCGPLFYTKVVYTSCKKNNFLLVAISVHNQEKMLWEFITWSPGGKSFDLETNSLNHQFFKGNDWRLVWVICT